MKKWADKYPVTVSIKQSSACIRPKRIIVTSNYTIQECYPDSHDLEAIKRRFNQIHHPFKWRPA